MKVQKIRSVQEKKKTKPAGDPVPGFMLVTACTCVQQLFWQQEDMLLTETAEAMRCMQLPGMKMKRFLSVLMIQDRKSSLQESRESYRGSINGTVSQRKSVERIGTPLSEQVMVGQRVKKIEDRVAEFDVSAFVESKVNALDEKVITAVRNPAIMSDEELHDALLRIVEAEAGDREDIKGRVLVANVIMNRVKRMQNFPILLQKLCGRPLTECPSSLLLMTAGSMKWK
ncbi:MAG: hypothetical protein ACLUTA_17335 [Blautia wexlerae]